MKIWTPNRSSIVSVVAFVILIAAALIGGLDLVTSRFVALILLCVIGVGFVVLVASLLTGDANLEIVFLPRGTVVQRVGQPSRKRILRRAQLWISTSGSPCPKWELSTETSEPDEAVEQVADS